MEYLEVNNYILEEDDNLDELTQDLLEVDKKEIDIKKPQEIKEDKKEIVIEINIDTINDNDLDFIDNDFEYIDEDDSEDDSDDEDTK